MSRQHVMLPSGSSRNKIEYLADYLDNLIIANPTMVIPGEEDDTPTETYPMPTATSGAPNFAAVESQPATFDSYPMNIHATFSGRLDTLRDDMIQFNVIEQFTMSSSGDLSNNNSNETASFTGILNDYKTDLQGRAPDGSNAADLNNYNCTGFVLLNYVNSTDKPTILNAELVVTPVLS
ncbi:hypothetical protein [Celerinatantimonas sp. MCCC 1A17872]|uniref:hypothetical protein n=1 Tax=Celerinatantimonas sp. MCCC 1A17872 TaxID=3177514 RepID=UPI0038C03342